MFLGSSLYAVEYGYLSDSSIELEKGDVIEFLGGTDAHMSTDRKLLKIKLPNGKLFYVSNFYLGHRAATSMYLSITKNIFVGPCSITTESDYVAYRITRALKTE
jgi:hypothetical protein